MKTLFMELGSPWDNGYVESFNGRLRDELLKRKSWDTMVEAKMLIERWKQTDNIVRPLSALGYRPSGPGGAAAMCARFGYASATAQGWSV